MSSFRVPCEFQIRFREVTKEELEIFRTFSMRPSPFASLKNEVETMIRGADIREESKTLFEKAFQILINLDQRMERIEEHLNRNPLESGPILESYEWVHGDLGAGGLAMETKKPTPRANAYVMLDVVVPGLPEHRFVAAGLMQSSRRFECEFLAIHEDDREFLHRFIMNREREILRNRKQRSD